MKAMLAAALALVAGCSVPDVVFDGGSAPDEAGLDAGIDVTTADATSEAGGGEAGDDGSSGDDGSVADAMTQDAPYDGPMYCNGNPPPDGGTCCSNGAGPVCVNGCAAHACMLCTASGPCTSPSVCCVSSNNKGVCQLPPC